MRPHVEILQRARDLITNPEAWTQGTYARDNLGRDVPTEDCMAVCFCSMGAIDRVRYLGRGLWGDRDAAICALANYLWSTRRMSIPGFNDHSEHKAVLAAFDGAIAYELSKEND